MKKEYIKSHINTLFLVLLICSSCNGQLNTITPTNNATNISPNSTGQPSLIKNHFSNPVQAAADNIHCGLQDKAGNLWFGTTGDGVYRYDGRSFTNFTMKDGLDSNQILSILEDKTGNIWFGSRKGICRYDGKSITKIPIPGIDQNNFYPASSLNINSTVKNAVWSIMQDRKGTIWFGTDEGIYCYNGKVFTRFLDNPYIINPAGLTLKSIQFMLEDAKGNFWFGSGPMAFEGICLYDGKKLTNYKPKNQQWIRKIVAGKNGIILFATRSAGISFYDPSAKQVDGNTFGTLPMPPKFTNGSLTNLLVDQEGIIWMASDYGNNPGDTLGGLWRSNLSSDNIAEKTFTKICNNEVFFMLEDKDHNIWLGTRGTNLYRYNRKTVTSFSE